MIKYLATCCALIALILASQTARAESFEQRLEKGDVIVYTEPVKGADQPAVVVKALINAPPEKIWPIVSNCDDYEKTMVRVPYAERLAYKDLGNGRAEGVCRVKIDMPFPYSDITGDTKFVHKIGNGKWLRTWTLLKGEYKYNRGMWYLHYYKGDKKRTMVVYRALAIPKAWIPNWVRKMAQKKSLPDMIRKIRKLVGA
ncbi:MAG: hypothetical protein H6707_15950 [Deltaproteobacteria bacterium]|nr:hypothetical protein [Deltaproteobacteria bacterium]